MMKRLNIPKFIYFSLFIFILLSNNYFIKDADAEKPIEWSKFIEFEKTVEGVCVIRSSDGNYVILANSGIDDESDICLIKIDGLGRVLWNKTYGGSDEDIGYSVKQTSDGGYIIAGKTHSYDAIWYDVLLIKTDADGNEEWHKLFGYQFWEWGKSVIETKDEGYIVIGTTNYQSHGGRDIYLIKTDYQGNKIWETRIGGPKDDWGECIIKAQDEGYVILGYTASNSSGIYDVYLINTDSNGKIIWEKRIGYNGDDRGTSIVSLEDDSYVITGVSDSNITNSRDIFLIKTDLFGKVLWDRRIGGEKSEWGNDVKIVNGDIVVVGQTYSYGEGRYDAYLLISDVNGNLLLNETIGGDYSDIANSVTSTFDDELLLTGKTDSSGLGEYDIYLVKRNLRRYRLTLNSEYSNVYGENVYYVGSEPRFWVSPSIVSISNKVRYVFDGWYSTSSGGYNGKKISARVIMNNHITEKAKWKKQIYIKINCSPGGEVSPVSGWYDAGSKISLVAIPDSNYMFSLWEGTGLNSYTGDKCNLTITLNSPIVQTAIFEEIPNYYLNVSSKYGNTTGSGTYQKGDYVEFSISPTIINVTDSERLVFNGWSCAQEKGYTGNESHVKFKILSSLAERANWKRQFLVNVTSSEGGNVFGAGWYDEGEQIEICCKPDEGYVFKVWEGPGKDNYSGTKQNFTLTLESPVVRRANFRPADTYALTLINPLGKTITKYYYENDKVRLNITSNFVEFNNNTRYIFEKWECNESTGYTGSDPNPSFIINEDINQKIIWKKQYYVEFDSPKDLNLSGWYTAGSTIQLEKNSTGFLIEKKLVYKIGNSEIIDAVLVNSPKTINVLWVSNYQKLYFVISALGCLSVVAGYKIYNYYKINKKISIYLDKYSNFSVIDLDSLKHEINDEKIYERFLTKINKRYIKDYEKQNLLTLSNFSDKYVDQNNNELLQMIHIDNVNIHKINIENILISDCIGYEIKEISKDKKLDKLIIPYLDDEKIKYNGIKLKKLVAVTLSKINTSGIDLKLKTDKYRINKIVIDNFIETDLQKLNYKVSKYILENTPLVEIPDGLDMIDIISMNPLLFPSTNNLKRIGGKKDVYIESNKLGKPVIKDTNKSNKIKRDISDIQENNIQIDGKLNEGKHDLDSVDVCPVCGGTGQEIEVEYIREDGAVTPVRHVIKCKFCNGTGTISPVK